jgi:hypothetical protein
MLNVRIEIQDNDDVLSRNKDFDEEASWHHIIISVAELIGAKYGYDIARKIRFIGYSTPFDDFSEYVIDPEEWKEFKLSKYAEHTKQADLFDEEE